MYIHGLRELDDTEPLMIAGMVNRGEWLGSPANVKGANEDAKI